MNPHLGAALGTFGRWLHLPDVGSVCGVLGAVAANRMPGDPVWLLFVGAPSSGKSEIINSLIGLPDVHPAATLTEAALLSGTPAKEKSKDSKGGLLRAIGDFGIILCKDFGSILNQNRDSQAQTLSALREVYDGSWTRHVGTDGGRTLHWSGKVGLIGGCTPSIDRRHAVMGTMGERFIFYRLAVEDDAALARAALAHVGKEARMRAEMSAAVTRLFTELDLTREPLGLTEDEKARLVALASFVVRCRSAVERDGYDREIDLIPDPEAPGRLCLVLARLLAGLDLIGLDREPSWRVVERAAMDSMPALRLKVIILLSHADEPLDTTQVALAAQYPTTTARRQLEELAAYGVVSRKSGGRGPADDWELSSWSRERLREVGTVPDIQEGEGSLYTPSRIGGGISGKVPVQEVARWVDL